MAEAGGEHGRCCCGVVELRQYTLRPGQRDTLVELFDRELVEPQETAGAHVVGQFRDLDAAERFVWLRGFRDMAARDAALRSFYGGPVWRQHRDTANATMVDSDDVLLLRPAWLGAGFPHPPPPRPALGHGPPDATVVVVVLPLGEPIAEPARRACADEVGRQLAEAGLATVAWLETEPAPNTFSALPVREGESVLVGVARAGRDVGRAELAELDSSIMRSARGRPQLLRLRPTHRSELR